MKILIATLVIAFSFINSNAFAKVDESQTDLYFANGIGIELDEDASEELWKSRVKILQKTNPQLKNSNTKIAYNSSTLFGVDDFMESFVQWTAGQAISTVTWNIARLFNHNEYVESALNKHFTHLTDI